MPWEMCNFFGKKKATCEVNPVAVAFHDPYLGGALSPESYELSGVVISSL